MLKECYGVEKQPEGSDHVKEYLVYANKFFASEQENVQQRIYNFYEHFTEDYSMIEYMPCKLSSMPGQMPRLD